MTGPATASAATRKGSTMSSDEFVYVPCGYYQWDAGDSALATSRCTAESLCRYCRRIEQAWDDGYDEAWQEEEGHGDGHGNPYTRAKRLGRSST